MMKVCACKGERGRVGKQESKIHLCAWALAVASRIYNYTMFFLERDIHIYEFDNESRMKDLYTG